MIPPIDRAAHRSDLRASPRKQLVVWITLAVLASSFGDVVLKEAMTLFKLPVVHRPSDVLLLVASLLASPWLDAGIVLMLVHFYAFVRALSQAALSVVVPLRSSTYILTTVLARVYLREAVPPLRWLAVAIILTGVCMVGRTESHR